MSSKTIQHELITHLPRLRAFAISLCGNADLADDLVQETILKAWRHLDSFQEGTNLRAWLFTILRNFYFSQLRQRRHEAPIDEDALQKLGKAPAQYGWMDSQDLLKALAQLSPEHREAIILVGAEGCTYEETAEICGCAVGTVKSRVNRARLRLQELLNKSPPVAKTTQPSPLPPAQIQARPARRRAAARRPRRDLLPNRADPLSA
jgi:RNA polymerase sigma-70 factor (ECF subfamily)